MTHVSMATQWSNLAQASPFVKQSTAFALSTIAIIVTIAVPELGFHHVEWFIAAAAVIVAATILALAISFRREAWRFEGVIASLGFISVALLRLATDSANPLMLFLLIVPVLMFAEMPKRRYIAVAAAGVLIALVMPVLVLPVLEGHAGESLVDLWVAVFVTMAYVLLAFIFHEVVRAHRAGSQRLLTTVSARDDLLRESVERAQQLQRSELELAAMERMLRGVWNAVTEQVVIGTDLSGMIDAWNPGAEKLLGGTAEEVEYHRNVTEVMLEEELDAFAHEHPAESSFEALVASARAGSPESGDWTFVRQDGSQVPVRMSVTARLGQDGEPVGYLFVANDVTEAREVAKLKDDFVGLISHELRTPLSSILGYLELMRDEEGADLTEIQLQYLGVAERNAHRLLRLVGDLLFTAQVESGSFQIEQTRFELGPVLDAAIESAGPVAAHAGVELIAHIAPQVFVAGDALRLGQAVDNLMSNAIKFTPRGGSVTLTLAPEGESAVMSVRDTGMGIAASELDKLFSKFFRATTAKANAVPGVGLGLAITRAIVIAHRGEMRVESEEGVGTCFTATLPLARVAAAVAG